MPPASALPWRHCYDISLCLGREDAVYPGDPAFSRVLFAEHAQAGFQAAQLRLSAHAGTHLDAPAHFFPQGKTLDAFPIQSFLRPALLIEAHGARVSPEDVLAAEELDRQAGGSGLAPGDAALFKTRNSRSGLARAGRWSKDFVALSAETAALLVQREIGLVGIDYLSVDPADAHEFPAHTLLLENNILILEGLDLQEPPAGRHLLVCLPLKIASAEAAPARAILLHW